MTTRQVLDKVLATLPEERVRQVLDFAQFLSLQEEQQQWQRSGLAAGAEPYGPEEAEYTEADLKPERNR
jgi:hypothetical protein